MDKFKAAIERGERIRAENEARAADLSRDKIARASMIVEQLARARDYIHSRGFHVYQALHYVAVTDGGRIHTLSVGEGGGFGIMEVGGVYKDAESAEEAVEYFLEQWASGQLDFLELHDQMGVGMYGGYKLVF